MTDEKMVKITEARHQELLDAEKLLDYLNAGGVDNWEGYADAYQLYLKHQGEPEGL